MTVSKNLTERADNLVTRSLKAKAGREAIRLCNRAIHAQRGAEKAVWEPLSNGVTLGALAEQLGVSYRTLTRWLALDGRQELYEECKRHAAQRLAEDTLAISDSSDPQMVQVSKLRVDTRRWLAARYDPQTFGERQQPIVALNLQSLRIEALRHVEMVEEDTLTQNPDLVTRAR